MPDIGALQKKAFQGEVTLYFNELYKLMWSMVWDRANPEYWLLDPEEIFAELCAELVYLVDRYGGNGKSFLEMKNILIVSLRNRVSDLCSMAYHTHRKDEIGAWSLDDGCIIPSGADISACDDIDADSGFCDITIGESRTIWNSSGTLQGCWDLEDGIESLSADAQELLRMAMYQDDERFRDQMHLAECRKHAISTKNQWGIKPTASILRRALGWPQARFKRAWEEAVEFVSTL